MNRYNSEKIDEIADILADGILRYKFRQFLETKRSALTTENLLDCVADKSVDGVANGEKGECA